MTELSGEDRCIVYAYTYTYNVINEMSVGGAHETSFMFLIFFVEFVYFCIFFFALVR